MIATPILGIGYALLLQSPSDQIARHAWLPLDPIILIELGMTCLFLLAIFQLPRLLNLDGELWFLALAPVIAIAMRHGYAGGIAAMAVTDIALTVLANVYGMARPKFEMQALMLVTAATGMLVGAAISSAREISARQAEQQSQFFRRARISELGQLAMNLSHQINQPLMAILNFADTGKTYIDRRDIGDTERAKEALVNVQSEANRAAEIIKAMRSFVHEGALNLKPDDINDIIHSFLSLASATARGSNIAIHLDLYPELPNVLLDRIHFEQVLMNLFNNSLDAMKGTSSRSISISTAFTVDQSIELRFSDTGSGIPTNLKDRLFEPLASSKPEGTGLGLTICRTIIEAHHSTIRLVPNDPIGTCCIITMPVNTDA